MSQESAAELRIYTGIHAGARATLPAGRYVLGADPSCDFILCDPDVAGRHAELRISTEAWMLHDLTADDEMQAAGMHLAPHAGAKIGSVVIAIDAANAPWGEVPPIAGTPSTVPPAAEPSPAPAEEATPSPVMATLPPLAHAPRDTIPVSTSKAPYLWIGLAVCAVLLAVPIIQALFDDPAESLVPVTAAAVHATNQDRVSAIIESLNLTQRTQVSVRPDGILSIQALLLNEVEHEQLASALSQINPRPEFKVVSEQELIREVRNFLLTYAPPLSADYLGDGRFMINGKVASNDEQDALLQALKANFPSARDFASALMTPDIFATKVLDELLMNGATDVSGAWQAEAFLITAKVPRVELQRWELGLLKTNDRFGKWFPYSIQTAFHGPNTIEPPFRIQSVVGGETPFIILADQSKVLLGGSTHGWRLTTIDAHQIVFEGPRRLSIPR